MNMLSCKEVSRLVSESLDRKLSLWQRMQVWMHLMMCDMCSRFRKQITFLADAARHYTGTTDTEGETSARLTPEARDRMKRSLGPESQ